MEVNHTCHDLRYWSEVLSCTIPTNMSDLEVKVTDLEKKNLQKFLFKIFRGKVRFRRAMLSRNSFYFAALKRGPL